MFKKVVILPAILLVLVCMTAFGVSAKSHKNKARLRRNIPDSVIYTLIFDLVDGYEKEADKAADEKIKNHLRKLFTDQAGLSEEEAQILRTVSRNFMSASRLISYKEKLRLSIQYRDELKRLFSKDTFRRFDAFVRDRIISGIKILKSDSSLVYGESSIDAADTPYEHYLRGYSSTRVFGFSSSQTSTCAVSAVMSGPNVSESGTDVQTCNVINPYIYLSSDKFLPNSQYCIAGTHTIEGEGTSTSSACLTTPANTKVTSVVYERISNDDLPIDVNPNAQNGLRIFPDKNLPTETVDRRKIRVRAKIGSNTAGEKVYFRSFDPDDPSANAAPIDPETTPNTNTGNDNNGNVDGTTNTRAGQFSASLTQYSCQTTANSANCFTDSNGEAVVDFTVTMQPGDNFTIAASNASDDTYLSSLVLAADGINLRDTSNNQTPVNTNSDYSICYRATVNACRTDLLTVWRRLHIEVDSMGNVSGNKVEGTFPAIGKVGTGQQTLPVNVSPDLEPNRFENGRIIIGSRIFRIINSNPFANPPVNANTINTVTINNTGGIFGIAAGQTFTLYDDDDYNDNNGANKIGDDGEIIQQYNSTDPILKFADSLKHLLPDDGNYSDNTPRNILGGAYIRPTYTWASQYNNNVPFDLNVEDSETQSNGSTALVDANRGSQNSERDDFWVAYIIFSYQPGLANDLDNFTEAATLGLTPAFTCDCYSSPCIRSINSANLCGSASPRGGIGSFVYLEVSQDTRKFWLNPPSPLTSKIFNEVETTVPHELGHQLGLKGDEPSTVFKIMDYQDPQNTSGNVDVGFHPEHINILRKRIKSPGQP